MGIEILVIEMRISFFILIGEIIATLVLHYRLPNRKRTLGIILMGIGLGVMGLLVHALYVLFELMMPPSYFHTYMVMLLILLYIPGLIFLFLCHSALLVIGIKLIRKYGNKRSKIEKEI